MYHIRRISRVTEWPIMVQASPEGAQREATADDLLNRFGFHVIVQDAQYVYVDCNELDDMRAATLPGERCSTGEAARRYTNLPESVRMLIADKHGLPYSATIIDHTWQGERI